MAKLPMRCPFNGKMCEECPLFRGRHYYLCTNEHYRGYIKQAEKIETEKQPRHIDFNTMKKLCEPWSDDSKAKKINARLAIKLKVMDRETGTTQIYSPDDAKDWKWNNPEIVRTFNGSQVGSFDKLMDILRYQEMKGVQEVTVIEAPWFLIA